MVFLFFKGGTTVTTAEGLDFHVNMADLNTYKLTRFFRMEIFKYISNMVMYDKYDIEELVV